MPPEEQHNICRKKVWRQLRKIISKREKRKRREGQRWNMVGYFPRNMRESTHGKRQQKKEETGNNLTKPNQPPPPTTKNNFSNKMKQVIEEVKMSRETCHRSSECRKSSRNSLGVSMIEFLNRH